MTDPEENKQEQYKYIHFVKVDEKPKTSVWECRNNKGGFSLGVVMWEPGWRQYCFYPLPRMVFSTGCMKDICDFITSKKRTVNKNDV